MKSGVGKLDRFELVVVVEDVNLSETLLEFFPRHESHTDGISIVEFYFFLFAQNGASSIGL